MVQTGLDRWISEQFLSLKGDRVGLVTHQAAIAGDLRHNLDCFLAGGVNVKAAFGPQHGIWGHTQDNMIEWEGYLDPRTNIPFYSLYGEHREPTDAMLEGLDHLVIDLQDVGTRVYTFLWTMALCLKAAARNNIRVTVLDRPNPIGGSNLEGKSLDPEYASFVGLHACPLRHGRTMGEMAQWLQREFYPRCQLDVVWMQGWDRTMHFDQTQLPWAMPSPNMPSWETALVYPGMVLLEGTNISEGRGTTRPFEFFGAPWIDPWVFCDAVHRLNLPDFKLRPITFQPTFHKFAGEVCGGGQIHVLDRQTFRPVLSAVAILHTMWHLSDGKMAWNRPPYEYETVKLPIDILAGGPTLRHLVQNNWSINEVREWAQADTEFSDVFLAYS